MATQVTNIPILYDSDAEKRLNNIKSAFEEFANVLGLTYEEISSSTTSIRCKLIHPDVPDDYMVWYISNMSSSTMTIYVYIDSTKDTNTTSDTSVGNVGAIFVNMIFSSWNSSSTTHYLSCIKSKDGKAFAFGYDSNVRYAYVVGKDMITNERKGIYLLNNTIVYYNENNAKSTYIINGTVTDMESLMLIKANFPNQRFIAESTFYPLMTYGNTSSWYRIDLNGKTYFITTTDGSNTGRIAFEV